jgi:hypothetical protein
MALIAAILALVAGWLGWSGWLAIPFGVLAFAGAHRAMPEAAGRINAVGLVAYCIGTFILMKVAFWIHAAFV